MAAWVNDLTIEITRQQVLSIVAEDENLDEEDWDWSTEEFEQLLDEATQTVQLVRTQKSDALPLVRVLHQWVTQNLDTTGASEIDAGLCDYEKDLQFLDWDHERNGRVILTYTRSR